MDSTIMTEITRKITCITRVDDGVVDLVCLGCILFLDFLLAIFFSQI